MATANNERVVVRALRGAAQDLGIELSLMGEGLILRLRRYGRTRLVYGYSFDLNSAASHQIACDKSATAEALAAAGVAHVPHHLYLHPSMAKYVPEHAGNWRAMQRVCDGYGWDVVVKENTGTGGRGVLRVKGELALERSVYALFARGPSLCISPFCEAEVELRFIVLEGACEVAFAKVRPSVMGDGRSTALELLAGQVEGHGVAATTQRLLESLEEDVLGALAQVPPLGASFLLNWRHNLGQGATARVLGREDPAYIAHVPLAIEAAAALNLRFGSIDILLTADGARVLEGNAGVMMDFLSQSLAGEKGADLACAIYGRALKAMFSP